MVDPNEQLHTLTQAMLDVLREQMRDALGKPSRNKPFFPTKTEVLRRASEKYDGAVKHGWQPDSSINTVRDEIWNRLRQRFRVVLDPADYKAEVVQRHFNIQGLHDSGAPPADVPVHLKAGVRVAPSAEAIPDEAARLHVELVDPNAVSFYSCGNTLAETVRRAAASGIYGPKFTACSSVVLATGAPAAFPPGAITAEFQRYGAQVKTLSYLLPSTVQDALAPSEDASKRPLLRKAIEDAVFSKALTADFLWLGIGTLDQPGSFTNHCHTMDVLKALEERGAVGEIGFMPFSKRNLIYDELGLASTVPDNHENWKRAGAPLSRFFNSTYVLKLADLKRGQIVVVAGGKRKHDAIWYGLEFLKRERATAGLGGIAYLVTDRDTLDELYARVQRTDNRWESQTVSLPADLLDQLRELAVDSGRSLDEVVRQAAQRHIESIKPTT